jgi:hypothetical protein
MMAVAIFAATRIRLYLPNHDKVHGSDAERTHDSSSPSERVPHLLFGSYLACAQALESKSSELNSVDSGSVSQKHLRPAHAPLALG